MEGFSATGQSSGATLVGTMDGESFEHAVLRYQKRTPSTGIELYTRDNFINEDAWMKKRSKFKIWGCALFDNEADARKAFG